MPKRRKRNRQCGTCQECCTFVHVQSLGKPSRTRCEHQCATGCAIYANRPSECRTYRCSWLEGYLGERDRPDHSGILFETLFLGSKDGDRAFCVLMGMITDGRDTPDFYELAESLCDDRTGVILIADDADPDLIGIGDKQIALLQQAIATMKHGTWRMADKVFQPGERRRIPNDEELR